VKHTITNTLGLIAFALTLFTFTTGTGFTVTEVVDAQQPTYTYVSSTPSQTREPLPINDPAPLTGDLAHEDTRDPAPSYAPDTIVGSLDPHVSALDHQHSYTGTLAPVPAPVATKPTAATPMPKVAPSPTLYAHISPEVVIEDATPTTPAAPICEEDMPCWDCSTMGNKVCGPTATPAPPAPTVPSIPPLTDACSEFETRNADGSCTPVTLDEQPTTPIVPPHAEPNPSLDPNHPIDCDNLQPGDAFAGIGIYCKLDQK